MSDKLQPRGADDISFAQPLLVPIKRRSFFMYAGATAGATALVLAGCSKDNTTPDYHFRQPRLGRCGRAELRLCPGAAGSCFLRPSSKNAAYRTGNAFSATELLYFTEVSKHEAIHRDFLKAAINRDAPGSCCRT